MAKPRSHRMTVAQIVNLIWPQIAAPGESRREVVSRIRSWLRDALESGTLTNLGEGLSFKGRVFDEIEILRLAREKWPGQLRTLPISASATLGSQTAVATVMDAEVIPGDLERCQRRLIQAFEEIEQLRAELRLTTLQLTDLKPLAEAYLKFKTRSGRRGTSV